LEDFEDLERCLGDPLGPSLEDLDEEEAEDEEALEIEVDGEFQNNSRPNLVAAGRR
jgi:hypothetical protein